MTEIFQREAETQESRKMGSRQQNLTNWGCALAWDMGDGFHRGLLGVLLKDGRLGLIHQDNEMISVQGITGRNKRDPGRTGFELVSESEATGWQGTCNCGWTGRQWQRVQGAGKTDLTRYRVKAAVGSPSSAPLSVEESILSEWQKHVRAWGLQMAARSYERAAVRLNETVKAARDSGLTWADIGTETGMSRQAAHQRWNQSEP